MGAPWNAKRFILVPVAEVDGSHPSSSFYAPVSSCEREADSCPPNSAFGSLVAGETLERSKGPSPGITEKKSHQRAAYRVCCQVDAARDLGPSEEASPRLREVRAAHSQPLTLCFLLCDHRAFPSVPRPHKVALCTCRALVHRPPAQKPLACRHSTASLLHAVYITLPYCNMSSF